MTAEHPPQQTAAEAEPLLAEVRRRNPGWDIKEIFGGLLAVPAGTPVVLAMWPSALEEKINQLDG